MMEIRITGKEAKDPFTEKEVNKSLKVRPPAVDLRKNNQPVKN